MNFPEIVKFTFVDSNTKQSIKNIAASLILYAYKKNDYYVGPKISDKNGNIYFTKDDCLKEIKSSQKFYIMDYSSNLEECLNKVSIKIKDFKELKLGINKMRQLRNIYQNYWDCSEEHLNALERVDNAKYINKIYDFSEDQLLENKIIQIELERRK